jgi:hypothetical protein
MNEVSGNIYTGNVIYADSLDWNGSMLTNTNDIYEGNLVLNSDNQAYLCAYRGNTFADEEIIVLGAQSTIGIQQPETKCDLFSVSTQSGSVQLIFKEDYSGSLKCLDASGRIVFSKTGKFLKDDEEVISSLTSGVYFLSTEGTKSFRFTVIN